MTIGLEGTITSISAEQYYRKIPKNLDTRKNCCNYPKIGTVSFYYRVMGLKDADRMGNSVDPDQTAPVGAV